MKPIALISDIHANIDALQAVLDDIDRQEMEEILCLGDVVGYGADPAECVKLVRERCSVTLMGNHDEYLVRDPDKFVLSRRIRDPLVLAKETVPKDDLKWLSKLPYSSVLQGFTIVHGSLNRPETFGYLMDDQEAADHFAQQNTPICFYGHTHKPAIALEYPDEIRWGIPGEGEMLLDRTKRCAINIGSVGQPRDGSTRATYGIYDPEMNSFTLRRVSYDIEKAAERIMKACLPAENAQRLLGEQ
jgi:diadenosine tetraphosphatase ApaH/serine/threonine PP2A family protein phosphatase